SIVPMQTFIEKIVGDTYEVVTIVPPGASPASYQPTPQEMTKISKAEYYFSIEVPTEKSNILEKIDEFNPDIKLFKVNEMIEDTYPERYFDDNEAMRDHHIWLSPKRVVAMVESMEHILSNDHPELSNVLKANSDEYISMLQELDEYIMDIADSIPNKTFIIYHPSYGYFADDYVFEMIAIEEEGKEETAKGIEKIVVFAKTNNIKVIFHQAEIDSEQAETIAREIGGITTMLTPLSENYIESMKEVIDAFSYTLK
ncbi:MAG: zinc ABC transporter substrate-binding protein, partial [Bacillota bacterium]|nr:zinc ABC transporter substrate-binding protein [Bacillota bacterium]